MTNARSIQGIIVLICALVAAIWLGLSIVTNQTETILQLVAGTFLIICFSLGKRIWLLIPFMSSLSFTLAIPGEPSTTQLGQVITLGFCLVLFLMRKIDFRLRMGEIEFWTLLLAVCVIQVYLRNPVGLNMLGGDSVGGRPYFLFILDSMTGLLFMGLRVPPREIKWLFPVTVAGGSLSLCISIFGTLVPSLGAYFGAVNVTGDRQKAEVAEGEATRIGFLGAFARNLALWIGSSISPLQALFKLKFAPLVLISFGCAVSSGFRNILITVGLIYLIALFYRGGLRSVLISLLAGSFALAGLAFINLLIPLPANIQRSLTFLPGTWEQRYKDDAEGSTDWRIIIWKEALFTPNWIENKLIGDGLGLSQKELRWMMSLETKDIGGQATAGNLTVQQEIMLITGGYHSGPVSVVRTIGYFGLAIVMVAFIRIAILGHRLIIRYRNTEWYPVVLLVGMPVIYGPIFWTFVYGTFTGASLSIIVAGGMIRFLYNNIPPNHSIKLVNQP